MATRGVPTQPHVHAFGLIEETGGTPRKLTQAKKEHVNSPRNHHEATIVRWSSSGFDESLFSRGRSKSGRGTRKAAGQLARWRLQLKTAIFGSIQQRIEKKTGRWKRYDSIRASSPPCRPPSLHRNTSPSISFCVCVLLTISPFSLKKNVKIKKLPLCAPTLYRLHSFCVFPDFNDCK